MRPTAGRGFNERRRGASMACKHRSRSNCFRSSCGLRLAAAFWVIALSVAPANARPYLDQSTSARSLPAPAQRLANENGHCEISGEWLQSWLREYWPSEGRMRPVGALGYMGQPGGSQAADLAEARTQVERIVRVSGLEMNFEMIVNPFTAAEAQIINGRRVILFDPRFMAQVADRICPNWGALSILAHEVGHHLAGHTLRQSSEPWRDELEADEFSGFVLARLSATQAEATSAAARILPEQSTPTHPGRTDRIAAIVHGWQNAKAIVEEELNNYQKKRGLTPMRQSAYSDYTYDEKSSDSTVSARIILYSDPNDYYITKSGRIDAYDGTRRLIARKSVPSSAQYAWSFHSDGLRLNVDFDGRISIRLPSGVIDEVGLVVPLMPLASNGD